MLRTRILVAASAIALASFAAVETGSANAAAAPRPAVISVDVWEHAAVQTAPDGDVDGADFLVWRRR